MAVSFEQALSESIKAEIREILRTGQGGVSRETAERFRETNKVAACRQCGRCCQTVTCLLSVIHFGERDTCPWFSFDEQGRAQCEFVAKALREGGPKVDIARAVVDFELGCFNQG